MQLRSILAFLGICGLTAAVMAILLLSPSGPATATGGSGDPWDTGPPDGTIDLANDILGVAFQYRHDCRP